MTGFDELVVDVIADALPYSDIPSRDDAEGVLTALREAQLTVVPRSVLDAAEGVAYHYEHYEDPDEWSIDRSDCPYIRRGLPGADPNGTCAYGCYDEPACMTGGPGPTAMLHHLLREMER